MLTIVLNSLAADAEKAAVPTSQPADKKFLVTDFGAVSDGSTLNTKRIQAAIDHAASNGGGTVVVPAGTFLSGALFLKPGVNLHLEKDAVIKGTTDRKDYPKAMTRIEGHFEPWLPALVNAEKCDHLRITGDGTLDGSGEPFWTEFRQRIAADRKTKNLDVERPRLIFIRDSRDVQLRNIHLKDSGFWNLHLYRCRDVLVEGLDIKAGPTSPSTDGVDVDSSQNVEIRGCTFSVNDDCIALKGSKGPLALEDKDSPPVEHIRISDCTVTHGESIVTCGSEATIVRDVTVENCRTSGLTKRGFAVLRLKLRPDTPQSYEDLHIRDITLDGTGSVISIAPWTQYFDLQGHAPPTESVRNVTISGVKGSCTSLGTMRGNKGNVIENVTLENIDIKTTSPKPNFSEVKNLVVKDVKINGEAFEGQ
jgi:alpha-L-rhamnosidase